MECVCVCVCGNGLSLYHTIPTYKKPFENIVGKGKSAGNQYFSISHSV